MSRPLSCKHIQGLALKSFYMGIFKVLREIPVGIVITTLFFAAIVLPPGWITHNYPLKSEEKKVFTNKTNFVYVKAFNPDDRNEIITSNGFHLLNRYLPVALESDVSSHIAGMFDLKLSHYPMRVSLVPKGTKFTIVDKFYFHGVGVFNLGGPSKEDDYSYVLKDDKGIKSEYGHSGLDFFKLSDDSNTSSFNAEVNNALSEFNTNHKIIKSYNRNFNKTLGAKILIIFFRLKKDDLIFESTLEGYKIEFKSMEAFMTFHYYLENFESELEVLFDMRRDHPELTERYGSQELKSLVEYAQQVKNIND